MNRKKYTKKFVLLIALIGISQLVFGHETENYGGGIQSGLMHPITGLDHVVAMIAVGLWGAQLKGKAIWVLPVVFPLIMAVGGVLGVLQLPLGNIELFIAISSIILGILVLGNIQLNLGIAIGIVAFFAIFHGYAHGAELPHSVEPMAYGVGFVISTGLLHLCGILIGTINKYKTGKYVVRGLGALIALIGIFYLINVL